MQIRDIHMKNSIVCLLLYFFLFFMLYHSVCLAQSQPATTQSFDAVQDVAPVSTWKDLLSQPVMRLRGGLEVRLGVERRRCTVGEGVLIYCLSKGFVPEAIDDGYRLGPLGIDQAPDLY